jgi:predicted glycosyltransferase
VIVRPPPDVSLYHRKSNPLFPKVLDRLGRDSDVHAVVLPRTQAQREFITNLGLPSVIVPDGAVEAQSLVALADLVLSAGGTMNREAAALGTPVYTTYGGRLGGVDEALIRSGRLRPLTDPRALELRKRTAEATPTRRDPSFLVETILGTVGAQPLREDPHPVTPS